MSHPGRPPPTPDGSPASSRALPPESELLSALRRIAACAARPAERSALIQTIVQQSAAIGGGSAALATVHEPGTLRVRGGSGALAWLEGEILPSAGSFVGEALRSRCPRAAAALLEHPAAHELERELGRGPALAVPLLLEGHAHGVLLLLRESHGSAFRPDEVAALEAVAEVAAGLVAGAAAYDWRRTRRSAAAASATPPAGLPAVELIRALRHEINNALAVVRGHAQLLERDPSVRELAHLQDGVAQVSEAVRRLEDLTGRMAVAETHPAQAFVTAEGGLGVVPESRW